MMLLSLHLKAEVAPAHVARTVLREVAELENAVCVLSSFHYVEIYCHRARNIKWLLHPVSGRPLHSVAYSIKAFLHPPYNSVEIYPAAFICVPFVTAVGAFGNDHAVFVVCQTGLRSATTSTYRRFVMKRGSTAFSANIDCMRIVVTTIPCFFEVSASAVRATVNRKEF